MKKYKVLEYDERYDCHKVHDLQTGETLNVDLMVDGAFHDVQEYNTNPGKFYTDIIGKTVEIERLQPYVTLGINVKIVNE